MTKQIKIYKLKNQKAKNFYALQNQKTFLWWTKQIKTKKIQKAKIFYELQKKKNYYSIDADKHTITKNKI